MSSRSNNKFVTLEETKKRYCPFASKSFSECMGEQCMSWRWTGYTKKTKGIIVQSKETHRYSNDYITEQIKTHGCCGLVYKGEFSLNEITKK